MDHLWRPHPIQGNNICPTCSIFHFPFCPPTPYPGPNFGPNLGPMNMPPPVYHAPSDPYNDPVFWNRNPNLPQMGDNLNRVRNPVQDHGFSDNGYVGNEYNVNDRSSKRLRVDGVYPGSYGSEFGERRFGFGDHGGSNLDSGLYYGQESSGFDRNVDAREPGFSSNIGGRTNPDMGYGVNNQRDEMGYGLGYGSNSGSFGSKFSNVDHHLPQYGLGAKQPDHVGLQQGGFGVGYDKDSQYHGYPHSSYGSSHVPSDGSYSDNFEPRYPNNAPPVQYEPRGNASMSVHYSGSQPPFVSTMQQPGQMRYDYHSPSQFNDGRQPFEAGARPGEGYPGPFANQHVAVQPQYGPVHGDNRGGYGNSFSENMGQGHFRGSQGLDVRPPLPASPPPPLPMEPPGQWPVDHKPSSSPPVSSSLFPVVAGSSNAIQSSYAPASEFHMRAHPHVQNSHVLNSSRGMIQRDSQATLTSSAHYVRESPGLPSKNSFPEKPKVLDASHLFKPLHRATRPDHFVIILRGLPGSGKSYLAKMLRDLEVEHGGNAPRIHSMDDYFMTEVEKAEENETSKSSVRGKKPIMKVVLEYCYEPEMEEAYRASMLKAFKKTLEEGAFTFVIVDDRNLRVADFAQFWATAKRSGYEVYVLEAPYKDPAGCTARNVHGFTQDDVEKMARQWEEAPSLYLQLDVKSLFHGDDLAESNIQEVDMDTEDGDFEGGVPGIGEREPEKNVASSGGDFGPDVSLKDERSWDADGDDPTQVKDLGHSKWSSNLDDDDDENTEVVKGKPKVLSGLLKTYGKEGKSVHWGDQGGNTGFSIGAVKAANAVSLVIGPGTGYNMKSNPMPEDDVQASTKSGETRRKHNVFKERLRAEQESFKAVFDRRRQRIGGLDVEDE